MMIAELTGRIEQRLALVQQEIRDSRRPPTLSTGHRHLPPDQRACMARDHEAVVPRSEGRHRRSRARRGARWRGAIASLQPLSPWLANWTRATRRVSGSVGMGELARMESILGALSGLSAAMRAQGWWVCRAPPGQWGRRWSERGYNVRDEVRRDRKMTPRRHKSRGCDRCAGFQYRYAHRWDRQCPRRSHST